MVELSRGPDFLPPPPPPFSLDQTEARRADKNSFATLITIKIVIMIIIIIITIIINFLCVTSISLTVLGALQKCIKTLKNLTTTE